MTVNMIDFDGYQIPPHTQETLENYLLKGFRPGGFVSAMLSKDFERSYYNADPANRRYMWDIGRWIMDCAPEDAWGSYDAIDAWCENRDGIRDDYVKYVEKTFIVNTLSKEHDV